MTNTRFLEMERLGLTLENEYAVFQSYSPSCAPHPYDILYKKIYDSLPLRGYVIYKLHEYVRAEGGRARGVPRRFFLQQLPFIQEVIISIQYYHNQILDRKSGVNTPESINSQLIHGNILERHLRAYIRKEVKPTWIRTSIEDMLDEILTLVDVGQHMEKHCNHYRNWENAKGFKHKFLKKADAFISTKFIDEAVDLTKGITCVPTVQEAFLRSYFRRVYLTNAALYILNARLLGDMLQVNSSISQFAMRFGVMHQIINDIGDLIPSYYNLGTAGKTCNDAFSDLKNRIVTLPLFIHLQRAPGLKIANYLKQQVSNFPKTWENPIFNEFVNFYSPFITMDIVRKIRNAALEVLEPKNPIYNMLKDTCSIADKNRYYTIFYRQKKYKEYKKKRRVRLCQQ